MKGILRLVRRLFKRKRAVHFISRLPVCDELADVAKEKLYGAKSNDGREI